MINGLNDYLIVLYEEMDDIFGFNYNVIDLIKLYNNFECYNYFNLILNYLNLYY